MASVEGLAAKLERDGGLSWRGMGAKLEREWLVERDWRLSWRGSGWWRGIVG